MRVVSGVGCGLAAVILLAAVAVPARALDTAPPTIVGARAYPPRAAPTDQVGVYAYIGDDTGVAEARVNLTWPDGTFQNVTMNGAIWYYYYLWMGLGLLGAYAFTIWARDAAGNTASARGSLEILLDTMPPTIEAWAVYPTVQVAGGPVTVSATITDDTSSVVLSPQVLYTLPDGLVQTISLASTGGDYEYAHTASWSLVGLYPFTIVASDRYGHLATASGSFRIVGPSDVTPPTIADAAASPPSQAPGGSVTISATVTDAGGLAGVLVDVTKPDSAHVNATMAATGDVYAYAASWDLPGTYAFQVWARDLAGNWASASGSFAIRTPDTTGPTIAPTPPSSAYVGDLIPVAAVVTDAGSGVAAVYLAFTDVNGVAQNVTMTLTTGGTYVYAIPAQGAAGTVRYRIYAVDASGNGARSSEQDVAVRERTAPPTLGGDPVVSGLLVALLVLNLLLLAAVALVLRRGRRPEPPPSP